MGSLEHALYLSHDALQTQPCPRDSHLHMMLLSSSRLVGMRYQHLWLPLWMCMSTQCRFTVSTSSRSTACCRGWEKRTITPQLLTEDSDFIDSPSSSWSSPVLTERTPSTWTHQCVIVFCCHFLRNPLSLCIMNIFNFFSLLK